jgi:2-iminobutanoate/2-iminopropanoate deaminase
MARTAVTLEGVAAPVGPFSTAVRAGDTLYLSGQVGQDLATGRLIEGDATHQAEQIFKNIAIVLGAAGKSFADVVRVGVYLTDLREYAAVNAVYARHFDAPYPARTLIGVAALPLGASIEIDLIAR